MLQKVLDNNSYSLHQENLIVCMLADHSSRSNRQQAVEAIKTIRKMAQELESKRCRKKKKMIREFVKPKVNMDATSHEQHLLMDQLEPFEPPITKGIPIEDLDRQVEDYSALTFPSVPCNTQAVERMVKLVTEVAGKEKLHSTRHWEILLTLDYYKNLPQHEKYSQPLSSAAIIAALDLDF